MAMIKGSKEWIAKLTKLREITADKIDVALDEGAAEIVAMQRHITDDRTGDLDRSIVIKKTTGRNSRSGANLARQITATSPYAKYIEFGTSPFTSGGKFKGADNPGIKAEPFFFTGYRAAKKGVKAKIRKAIRAAVKEAAGK